MPLSCTPSVLLESWADFETGYPLTHSWFSRVRTKNRALNFCWEEGGWGVWDEKAEARWAEGSKRKAREEGMGEGERGGLGTRFVKRACSNFASEVPGQGSEVVG